MKNKTVAFFVMHFAFVLYVLYSVVAKRAAREDFLSAPWLLLYGMVFVLLFLYALLWQQVLKVIPLTTATANKTITIVWGIGAGFLFFDEAVTVRMLIGALIILLGILLLCSEKEDAQ